jgi:hypothetical protein
VAVIEAVPAAPVTRGAVPSPRDESRRRLRRRLIVPTGPVERLARGAGTIAYVVSMLRDVVAVLVLVLMFGDITRMLLADR